MRNTKGFSTVVVCVIVLAMCMFLAVLVEYGAMYNCAEAEKTEAQLKLDSLATSYAVEKYDALKQGKVYDSYLNQDELVSKAYEALDFKSAATTERLMQKGSLTYSVQRPQIRYLSTGEFGVEVTFDVIVPFTVVGQTVTDIAIPVKLVSKYTER